MRRRLFRWFRTLAKLSLLLLAYLWSGAAYKLVYAQTHDITRFRSRIPLPYYQQQFLIDTLLGQTWLFGPEFRALLGRLPPLAALAQGNPYATLRDYLEQRERELAALPERHPDSLFADEALDAASRFYSATRASFGFLDSRRPPARALAFRTADGDWQSHPAPDASAAVALARRLADDYPESPYAPAALLELAEAEARQGNLEASRAAYRRLAAEYPHSDEAVRASDRLYEAALAAGDLAAARQHLRRSVAAMERLARERFPRRPLPREPALRLLGFRVDLAALELQLARRIERARAAGELLVLARHEAARLRALAPASDGASPDETELGPIEGKLARLRNELWIAELYDALRLPLPGPPPRSKQGAVSGRVLLEDRPLPGILVELSEPGEGVSEEWSELARPLAPARYRARTDAAGRFEIAEVPAGRYALQARYPLRPAASGRAPILPAADSDFPSEIAVGDRPIRLPPLRFVRALPILSRGELPPAGEAVRLAWAPWPGAVAYRVEVFAAPGHSVYLFRHRWTEGGEAFRSRPLLWKQERVPETQVFCPLAALAAQPLEATRLAQYRYVVMALDAHGAALARTADPEARFQLSADAVNRLFAEEGRRRAPSVPRPARRRNEGGPR